MAKGNLYTVTGLIAAFTLAGVSITGAAIRVNGEFCKDKIIRGCYELDAGPFNLAKLPLESRANDTFMMNYRAGTNKWAACERTNPDSIIETEMITAYCGPNAVEKVKTCQMGLSKVMLYYYTGQCRVIGYTICDSMFTMPSDCVNSGSTGLAFAESLIEQLYNQSRQYPKDYEYGYCTPFGDYQIYMKQEIRRISEDPIIQYESDYWWVYELNESCVEGDPLSTDYHGERRVGDILADVRLLSDLLKSTIGIKWSYRVTVEGCTDFPNIFIEGSIEELDKCTSSDNYFCGCGSIL